MNRIVVADLSEPERTWCSAGGCEKMGFNECSKCPGKLYCYEHRNHVCHSDTDPIEARDGGMAQNADQKRMGWILETETGDTYDKEMNTEVRSHNL